MLGDDMERVPTSNAVDAGPIDSYVEVGYSPPQISSLRIEHIKEVSHTIFRRCWRDPEQAVVVDRELGKWRSVGRNARFRCSWQADGALKCILATS